VKRLVVRRARQRRQDEEFEQIDRQFLLHGLNVMRDPFRCVTRKT